MTRQQIDRTIVVTGGGTGIGRATATWFAAAGDHVTIVGRRHDVLAATAADVGATPVVADLATPAGVAALTSALPDHVDVLVNNAGGNTDLDATTAPVDALDAAAASWNANWTSNVLTAVLTTTALSSRLADGGRVVNIGSIASPAGAGSYGAVKAALESWTVSLSGELGVRGITVNLVAPGYVEDTEFFRGRLGDARKQALAAATATGRAGRPDDVAATIGFLASPAAGHITGQVLHVNGGAHHGR